MPSEQLFSGAGKIYSPSIKAEETNFCFWNIICQTFVSAIEHSETIQYINWFWDNSTSFNKKGCLFETEGTMIWCLCSESVGIWWTINLKHRFDGNWIRMKITWIFREKFYELIADLIILVETVFKAFIVDLKTDESKVLQNCIKFCKLNHTVKKEVFDEWNDDFYSVCKLYIKLKFLSGLMTWILSRKIVGMVAFGNLTSPENQYHEGVHALMFLYPPHMSG